MAIKIKRGGFLEAFLPAMMQLKMTQDQSNIYEASKLRENADYFNRMSEDRRRALQTLILESFVKSAHKDAEGQPYGALGAMKTIRDVVPADAMPAGVNLPADLPMRAAAARAALGRSMVNAQAGEDILPPDIETGLEGYGEKPVSDVVLQAIQNKIDREKLASAAENRGVTLREIAARDRATTATTKAAEAEIAGRTRKVQAGTLENIDEQITTSKGREQLYMRDLATELKKQNIKVPEGGGDAHEYVSTLAAIIQSDPKVIQTPEIEDVLSKLDEERAKQEQLYVQRSAITGDLGRQVYDSLVADLKAKGFTKHDLEKNQDLLAWLKSQEIDVGFLKKAFK